jgi:hypothetical protein
MPVITLDKIQAVIATPDAVNDVDNEWDGSSYNKDSQQKQPNKDSKMDWDEHQKIVFDAGALLVNFNEEMGNQDQASASLDRLKKAYGGSEELLRVTKGIHQPYSDPHIQLGLWSSDGKTKLATYHLNVSASATELNDDNFQWKAVQFVGYGRVPGGDKSTRCWPASANHVTKKQSTRRHSISSPVLAALVEKNNERLAAAEEKKKNKIADDLAHPEKVMQRNGQKLLPILASKGITIKKYPKGQMELFMKGETVTVVYKKGGSSSIDITGSYDGSKFTYEDGKKSIGGLAIPKI